MFYFELFLAFQIAKTMVLFSHCVFDLTADNCFLGKCDETKENTPLQLFERVASDLGRAGRHVKRYLENN
jgi:hypothetical protein